MAMFEEMGTVKIGNRGLITVPVEVRMFLKLKPGDKIAFIREDDGYTYVENAANLVLKGSEEARQSVEETQKPKDTTKKRAMGKTTVAKTDKKPTKSAPAKTGKRKTATAAHG
jgi:AbrB family looped-hinge helix DNA binding protein